LWLGNELYQYLTERGAHVAYMGHFGGLVGGAVIGVLYRWMRPVQIANHHRKAAREEIDMQAFQRGMDFLGAMEFKKALSVFKPLQEQHPHDLNLKRLVYRAAKADPASDDYHRAARKLLSLSGMDEATSKQTHEIFHEYLDVARPGPRLGAELLAKLARRFADDNYFDDAEKLAGLLQRLAPQHRALPSILLSLGRSYYRAQRKEKFETILQSLISQFPQSDEARVADKMLQVI
jgi:outer membrane protein assembly factor BamD (BamD/ComL family)